MSFKSVWGFDPDEAIRAQKLSRRAPDIDGSVNASEGQEPLHIPLEVAVQVYELRRMFRL